jgi:hypothetical protein
MKRLLLLLSIAAITACNREESRLGLEAMSLKTTDQQASRQITDEQLIALAHNKEHIHVSVADVKKVLDNIKENKPYSIDTLNLFKTAVHRFYSNVSVKDKQLTLNLGSGEEIGIEEDLFQKLRYGVDVLNKDLSKKNEATASMTDSSIISSIHDQLRNFPN